MSNPHPLGERELTLINLYAYWELELEPRTFYAKWDVTYEQIALICARSALGWCPLGNRLPQSGIGFKSVKIIAHLLPAISAISR
jgi:hypothetical protein